MREMEYIVDEHRFNDAENVETGIVVRAKRNGRFDAYDITVLDRQSLWEWLLSRGRAEWPASVVMSMLGHSTDGLVK